MTRIQSRDLPRHAGQPVLLRGWLHHRRDLANVTFLILRDGTGTAQVAVGPDEIGTLPDLNAECAIEVSGHAVADARAPGGVEVREPTVSVIANSSLGFPFELGRPHVDAALPTLLDPAALSLRHLRRRAVFRLMHATVGAFRAKLTDDGFTEVFTPKIVGTATESGANCFKLDYFGRSAYLAQSPQLYKQMLVGVFEKVFEVGPVFRAEPHDTPRHLNEYVSLDVELGFISDHGDVMAVLASALREMASAVGQHEEAHLAGASLPIRLPPNIPTVHFGEALKLLSTTFGKHVESEPDLAPAHERWLGDWALSETDRMLYSSLGFR